MTTGTESEAFMAVSSVQRCGFLITNQESNILDCCITWNKTELFMQLPDHSIHSRRASVPDSQRFENKVRWFSSSCHFITGFVLKFFHSVFLCLARFLALVGVT